MNQAIANIVRDKIKGLAFMDKVAGLVRPLTFKVQDDNGTTTKKTFPVSCEICWDDCVKGKGVQDLVPDSDKRSVTYFEDLGVTPVQNNGTSVDFVSNLKLVCWLNMAKMGKNECSISGVAIAAILAELPVNFFNSGIYTRIRIETGAQSAKDPAIFSKYSYDESTIQFLMHPYDYFSINIKTSFRVSTACLDAFETNGSHIC